MAGTVPGRQYRAGVIGRTGAGNYGHGLDVVWRGLEQVTVVAVADEDAEGRAAAQARSGAERAYADYHEMLAREHLDVVSVAPRWLDVREEMVLAAIDAGVRGIYCEKPFARTLAESDRMLAAAGRSGTRIALALQHRVMPVVREMRRIVASGELGEIREVRSRPTIGPRGGAFLITVLGTHILDLIRFLLDTDPQWAFGRLTSRDGREVEAGDAREAAEGYGLLAGDAIAALYGFPGGVTASCDSYFAPNVIPGTMTVEVWGTEGVIALRDGVRREGGGGRELIRWSPRGGQPVQQLEPQPEAASGRDAGSAISLPQLNEVLARDLLAAIEEERQPLSSGEDGRWALEMITGAHEAHLSGARVPLPCSQRENSYVVRRQ